MFSTVPPVTKFIEPAIVGLATQTVSRVSMEVAFIAFLVFLQRMILLRPAENEGLETIDNY